MRTDSTTSGHDTVRTRMPSCSKGEKWRPWTAILTSCAHPIAMLAATVTMRVNGFYPNIFWVFAMWTMRPRMVAAPLWFLISSCWPRRGRNPYLWTFKDNILEESMLNIFSLPFALYFISVRNDSEQGWCAEDPSYLRFWDSFYLIVAAGALSVVIVSIMIIHSCTRLIRGYKLVNHQFGGTQLSHFWKWMLWLGSLNVIAAFAGQWLLWGSKSLPSHLQFFSKRR